MANKRPRIHGWVIRLLPLIFFIGIMSHPASKGFGADAIDLTELSIEDLMDITVTSVSKKSQSISEAAAAVFVITQEDIRRSGATTIPDALRMVPGVQVGKIDANKWAVTARGANGRFANKLLILMDGRSLYTPIYSGVFWENVDTVIEDIERIEVIRGPGASLWGANAVNGVINIITKTAEKTEGALVSTSMGTEEKINVSLRYGGTIGEKTPFRVFAKGFKRDGQVDSEGNDTADDWRYLRGGFKIDHHTGGPDDFTLQGDMFDGTNGETIAAPTLTPPYMSVYDYENNQKGYSLLGRWKKSFSNQSDMSLQAYYHRNEHILHVGHGITDTLDLEFQHRFPLGRIHDITWGGGYRLYKDNFNGDPFFVVLESEKQSFYIFNTFLQDEISLFDKKVHLTLGSKIEYHDYTGFEIQPNARLLWKPNEKHSTWFAVSRAVRTPSRIEHDSQITLGVIPPSVLGPLPVKFIFEGSEDNDSENLTAYELGYRFQSTPHLAIDTAVYYNDYTDVKTVTTGDPYPGDATPTYIVLPLDLSEETEGEVYGFELAADVMVSDWLTFRPAYTFMENNIEYSDSDILAAQDPQHQFSLRTSLNLPRNIECDLWYRYVDEISEQIDAYNTIDIRLGWKYSNNLEFSIVSQNLLNSHHAEFTPEALHTVATEVERGIYGKIVWRFR